MYVIQFAFFFFGWKKVAFASSLSDSGTDSAPPMMVIINIGDFDDAEVSLVREEAVARRESASHHFQLATLFRVTRHVSVLITRRGRDVADR